MDYHKPKARDDLHSWRYYSTHFSIDNVHQHQKRHVNEEVISKHAKSFRGRKSYCKRVQEGLGAYCEAGSLHGLKYVGDNNISKAERVFWFIAFLSAISMAIFFISNLYINYEANPVIVSFNPELVNVHEIPFPGITICNANIAAKDRAEHLNLVGSPAERLILADLCKWKSTEPSNIGSISWQTVEATIFNVTQKCTEMILVCKWQGHIQPCHNLINSVITDDGYCCSFNKLPLSYALRETSQLRKLAFPDEIINWNPQDGYPANVSENVYPYRAFGRGIEQGLTLVLDANLEQYYCSTTSSIGFKILFATPLESPKVADLGFMVQPGIEARIPINVQISDATSSVEGVNWKKRRCIFPRERELFFYHLYSARNCMLECEANYTLETCGCTTFDMPRRPTTKICDKNDDECIRDARFQIERAGPDKNACDCLPGCFEIYYKPELISTATIDKDINTINEEYIGNFSREYFASNMGIIHFYYSVDKFQKQTKNTLYGFPEFLSQTGGLLGLFLGFSFLSVVEIFYFLFMRSTCKWGRNKLRNYGSNNKLLYVK